MPSVLVQFQLSADSTSGEGRIFSRFFNEYRAVTTPTSGEDPRIKRGTRFFRGGSPGLADWQRSDADAIGIYPVHWEWTIVDGGWKSRTVRHFAESRWRPHRRCLTRVRHLSPSQGALQRAHPDSAKSHLALVLLSQKAAASLADD